ncbi:MAG: response regulator transcription factor [Chloroflexota bacterium]|nr:response regulator transcription factor [Chloroflexota bacterium]
MIQMLEEQSYQVRESESAAWIRVIIVDTHTLMLSALRKVVAGFPQTQICISLSTLHNTLVLAKKMQAHVIVLSSSLSVSDCLTFMHLISESQVSVGVVIIQHCLSPETTITLIKQGIQSLLGEDASEEDLAKAITAAATGNTFLDRHARELLNSSVSKVPMHFTIREIEVLSLLNRGESNYRIAYALGLKEKTIEKHLTHIYEKLHISSRSEAILQTQRLSI